VRSLKDAVKSIDLRVIDQIFNGYLHSLHILGTRGENLCNAICYLCLCWQRLKTSPHRLPSVFECVNYFWSPLDR